MLARLKRVDLARLAGVGSILGIDLDAASVRIVPVKKRGNPLDKYKASFSAEAPLTCEFPPAAAAEAKGLIIKEALGARAIKTRSCVATVRSPGVRTVTATIPASAGDISEWITEHAARLLKLPIPLADLEVRWNILDTSSTRTALELTFVRKRDLEDVREVLKAARLTLLSLSAGVSDVLNTLLVSDPLVAEKNFTVAYVEGTKVSLLPLTRAKRSVTVVLPQGLDASTRSKLDEGELHWAGVRSFSEVLPQDRELKPYNLTPEYALATGLALKGFLPELNPVDFLSEGEREQKTVSLWQGALQRTAMSLGSILFLVLALQAVASMALGHMKEEAEDEVNTSQALQTEVKGLRERVNVLEAQVQRTESGASQGNLSRVLHELARAVPASVRIDRLQAQAQQQNTLRLTLSLSARSQEAVTTFMKQLEQTGFSDVTLMRLSASEGAANSSPLLAAELEVIADPEVLP